MGTRANNERYGAHEPRIREYYDRFYNEEMGRE
jgi:hypothetical protein